MNIARFQKRKKLRELKEKRLERFLYPTYILIPFVVIVFIIWEVGKELFSEK